MTEVFGYKGNKSKAEVPLKADTDQDIINLRNEMNDRIDSISSRLFSLCWIEVLTPIKLVSNLTTKITYERFLTYYTYSYDKVINASKKTISKFDWTSSDKNAYYYMLIYNDLSAASGSSHSDKLICGRNEDNVVLADLVNADQFNSITKNSIFKSTDDFKIELKLSYSILPIVSNRPGTSGPYIGDMTYATNKNNRISLTLTDDFGDVTVSNFNKSTLGFSLYDGLLSGEITSSDVSRYSPYRYDLWAYPSGLELVSFTQ